ncbi:hypothetical protein LNKW23_11910 [Paralimibaculum aggregatum]|uniref:DUF4412 domain-containing protein n=1 Tax=Paralimibaculum aggregatum TaxID=3036245 RepID=A0ABQ6LF78_9RHOB|nr:hypothetical protein [Limibaculum sp. NKW23]GMG81978.1 hypothetical protein LNKW23_11910 [Limibaculum sp. NKW23]
MQIACPQPALPAPAPAAPALPAPALAILALLAAGPAAAACPTAADLEAGIEAVYSDGFVTRYSRSGPDRVLELNAAADGGQEFYTESHEGLLILREGDSANGRPLPGTETRYRYLPPVEELPEIRAGAAFSAAYWALSGAEATPFVLPEKVSVRAAEAEAMALGACRFEMLDVEMRWIGTEGTTVSRLGYLTELGIALLLGSSTVGRPELDERYTPVDLRLAGGEGETGRNN